MPTPKKAPLPVHFRVSKSKVAPEKGRVYAVMLTRPEGNNDDDVMIAVRTLDKPQTDTYVTRTFLRHTTDHATPEQYAELKAAIEFRMKPRQVGAYPKLTREFIGQD